MSQKRKSVLVALLSVTAALTACAQDLHFSQWFNSPLTTNPANTGFIPDADYRLGANYRNQWSSVMSEPYKTMSIFGDAQVFRNRIQTGWLGLGGVILRDVAGSGNLTTTEVYGSVGWVNKRINSTNLKFPDQFDGKFFDNQLPTSVVIDEPNVNFLDIQVGMNYAYFPNTRTYFNAGFSVQHLNNARESFFSTDPTGFNSLIPRRYIGFLNGSFKTSDQVIINPMAYYTNQAGASEIVTGFNAQYNLSDNGENQVIGGLYYRLGDAFIPMIGFIYKNIHLSFTFDITTSSLSQTNQGRGAWEFALIENGIYNEYNGDRHQSMCPDFKR
jgi:Type IX secretion system membrane protein PorP/SprF